jgi:hypothetical protein
LQFPVDARIFYEFNCILTIFYIKKLTILKIALEIHGILWRHCICRHIILKMFGLKEGLNAYNYDMCGMMSYMISDKNICYRCYPCSTSSVFDPRLSIFVFEAIRIRIRIRIKIWKQIWFHWYPSVFDPITPLVVVEQRHKRVDLDLALLDYLLVSIHREVWHVSLFRFFVHPGVSSSLPGGVYKRFMKPSTPLRTSHASTEKSGAPCIEAWTIQWPMIPCPTGYPYDHQKQCFVL